MEMTAACPRVTNRAFFGLAFLLFVLCLTSVKAQSIRREFWLQIPGANLAQLRNSPDFPDNWSGVHFPTSFEGPINWNDNYGSRFRGYILPPVTGEYVFWISGDDHAALYLSRDEGPETRELIASVAASAVPREWDKTPQQQSEPVYLEAGKRYYIEAQHKEGYETDHIAVGWRLPDGSLERPIPGRRLAPFLLSSDPPILTQAPVSLTLAEGERAEFRLAASGAEPLLFQWERDGKTVPGETFSNLILEPVRLEDDGARLRCRVNNPFGAIATDEVVLRVVPEQNPPRIMTIAPPADSLVRTLTVVEVSFDEAVRGVDAADLLINETPASSVSGIGAGPYRFTFDHPAAGAVSFRWAPGHGITDASLAPNGFAGGQWQVTVDPGAQAPGIAINEFLASNLTGLEDEEGAREDWIELYNPGPGPASLNGWSLSDDPKEPGQWIFPDVTIAPQDYLVVFASGKDRRDPDRPLHTNFKLARSGGFLGLYNHEIPRQPRDLLSPSFPEQRGDYSYGRHLDGTWRYYGTPTPGARNGIRATSGIAERPRFSTPRGFYEAPFDLHLNAEPGASIRYTTDGSEPTASSTLCTGPIHIQRATVLRAAAFEPDRLPSETVTQTYLVGVSAPLRSLPALSLVTAENHLWGPTGIMETEPRNTLQRGRAWERPVSAEFIRPEDHGGFQIDCGLRVRGGVYVRERYDPNDVPPFSKYSFRLDFRGDYGTRRLAYPLFPNSPVQEFDELVLRAGMNDHTDPFITDELCRRLFAATGQVSSHGTLVNLFINGVYKGYYNPTERIHESFLRSWHSDQDWDLISQGSVAELGDAMKWNEMKQAISDADFSHPAAYANAGALLHLDNFIDYLLVNIYAATRDWPYNNWRAARPRRPDGKFQFLIWDAEVALGMFGCSPHHNTLSEELGGGSEIAMLFGALRASPAFRMHFADRLHRHFFNGGALTDQAIWDQYWTLRREMEGVLPDMADYIHQHWIIYRRQLMFDHLSQAGFYASDHAPVFSQHGGRVPSHYQLFMNAPRGVIYYTLDGSDPRLPDPAPDGNGAPGVHPASFVYAGPVELRDSLTLKARTLDGADWSALNEATFTVNQLGSPLRFTEIMYDPPGGDAYEFLELHNTGFAPIDLSGFTMQGVQLLFSPGSVLAGGGVWVLASGADPPAFMARYPGLAVAAWFGGSLANGGERLALRDPAGNVVLAVAYDNRNGWPSGAAGDGYSLELTELHGEPTAPGSWRASPVLGGTPGVLPHPVSVPAVRLNELMALNRTAVPRAGKYPDWIELFNGGAESVDLAGWSLTDNADPRQFVFPADARLEPGAYLVVWCDSDSSLGLHAGFALNRDGESVFLYDAMTTLVDAVSFGLQPADFSLGRVEGAGDPWQLTRPTPGGPNLVAASAPAGSLVINEWLASPIDGLPPWFELHNTSLQLPISLHGLLVGNGSALHRLAARSHLEPGGFLQIFADETTGADRVNFKLSAAGGQIALYDVAGELLQRRMYGPQTAGVSQGLLPDGGADVAAFPGNATPGSSNFLLEWSGPVLNEFLAINQGVVTQASGRAADWLELHNPGLAAFDLEGMSLSIGRAQPGEWVFPKGAELSPHGYFVVWCDNREPPTSGLAQELNTGRALSGSGDAIYLFDMTGRLVDAVAFGFQLADGAVGRSEDGWRLLQRATPGAPNAAPAVLGDVLGLCFNEWLANPLRGDDFIELFNRSNLPVELSGLYLTDDPSLAGRTRFRIGPLTFIAPRGWVSFLADGGADPASVNFGLNAEGEHLRLYEANLSLIDAIDFGRQAPGVSSGRLPDGGEEIVSFPVSASPGDSNYLPLEELVINEVLAHSAPPFENAIEIHSLSATEADISGWYLSDEGLNLKKFRVPPGTIVPAHGYAVFYENQFSGGDGSLAPFKLNPARDATLRLSHATNGGELTGLRAQISFGPSLRGVSLGRHVTSHSVEFVPQAWPSFGVDAPASVEIFRTGRGAANPGPLVGPVVINEIMAAPPEMADYTARELEFVELKNMTGQPVLLFDPAHPANTWRVRDGVEFRFPPGVTIGPFEHVILVTFDPAADAVPLASFQAHYRVAHQARLFGPIAGRLAARGERLELARPDLPEPHGPDVGRVPYCLVEGIDYAHAAPWPEAGIGEGASLQRLVARDFGNEALNWRAGLPTPGGWNSVDLADSDGDGMPDFWERTHGLDPLNPGDASEDPDGDGVSNLNEYLAGTDPANPESRLRILELAATPDGALLRFLTEPGRGYSILCADCLVSPEWRVVRQIEAAFYRREIEFLDPYWILGERYYRILSAGTD